MGRSYEVDSSRDVVEETVRAEKIWAVGCGDDREGREAHKSADGVVPVAACKRFSMRRSGKQIGSEALTTRGDCDVHMLAVLRVCVHAERVVSSHFWKEA